MEPNSREHSERRRHQVRLSTDRCDPVSTGRSTRLPFHCRKYTVLSPFVAAISFRQLTPGTMRRPV